MENVGFTTRMGFLGKVVALVAKVWDPMTGSRSLRKDWEEGFRMKLSLGVGRDLTRICKTVRLPASSHELSR